MSKYDFEIDLSPNTSTGMILNQIQKGSVVLEFGCATGRMTRYMKEVLDCRVYIVEYDRSAYETARQYAEDGLCDDILTFQWAEIFSGIAFDAIIFADVLEHLTAPEKVLEAAAKLLKDTGCVYASIPNVTHNDILLKACQERFDYTATGLLDDTHIHFWGLENIKEISGKCGLYLRKVEGTYCPTGDTEQRPATHSLLLENILHQRLCGEVYQFVATFDKNGTDEAAVTFRVPTVKSHIYLDKGNGFNTEDVISVESEPVGAGIYRSHYVLEGAEDLCAIRFDPVELQECIVCHIAIRQAEVLLPLHFADSIVLKDGILLRGNDPMVCANVHPKNGPITIDATFVLAGETYLDILETACASQRDAMEGLTAEKKDLQKALVDMSAARDTLQKTVDRLSADNEDLQRDVCAYITLANNKEKYALQVERERDALQARYENMKIVKMRAFAVRIYKATKRWIKRVLGKE